MASLKNFICGLCAVGFDTLAEMHHHKQLAEHVSFNNNNNNNNAWCVNKHTSVAVMTPVERLTGDQFGCELTRVICIGVPMTNN